MTKLSLSAIKQGMRRLFGSEPAMDLDPEMLKQMARGVMTTRPDEIGCQDCFEQVDAFVELTLAGRNAAEAMPLVQDHLQRCKDCREEFEALLAALRAMT